MNEHLKAALEGAAKRREKYKYSNSKETKRHISYHEDYNYVDCLCRELEENTEMREFFKMISDEYKKELERKNSLVDSCIDELVSKKNASTPSLNKLKTILEARGLKLSYSVNIGRYGDTIKIRINNSDPIEIDSDDVDKVLDSIKFTITANEIDLIKYEDIINNLDSKINKINNKLKFSPINRDRRKNEVKELNRDLSDNTYEYNKLIKENEALNAFVEMNDEEKELFARALVELKSILSIEEVISEQKDKQNDIRYSIHYGFDSDAAMSALGILLDNGSINQLTMEKMFLMLDRVEIKGRRGEYTKEARYFSNALRKIAEWFVHDIYEVDESFIERNYYLPSDDEELEDISSLKLTK